MLGGFGGACVRVLVIVYGEVIVVMLVCQRGMSDTEIDIILKLLLIMVALRLQLQHHSLSPIRLSIIHVRDFMGFSRYFICIDGEFLLFTRGL